MRKRLRKKIARQKAIDSVDWWDDDWMLLWTQVWAQAMESF